MQDRVVLKPIFVSFEKSFSRGVPAREKVMEASIERWEELKRVVGEEVIVEKPFVFTSLSDFSKLYRELHLDIDALIIQRLFGGDHRRLVKFGLLGFPVIFIGSSVVYGDVIAYINYYGGRAFYFKDYEGLRDFVDVLKAYRRIRKSVAIVFTSTGLPSYSTVGGGWDLEKARRKFGIEFTFVSNENLLNEFRTIDRREVEELFRKLVKHADVVKVDDENIVKALRLYVAMKNFIERVGANMLTITCAEEIFYKNNVTPCLPLVLFKDEGLPASCEGDVSALLAMSFLMYLSGKPAFMGNLWYLDEKGVFRLSHDVFPLKFCDGECRYELHDFHDKGYGVTTYVEVEKNSEITLARMHFDFNRILVFKATILESHQGIACRQSLDIKVENSTKLEKYLLEYGHHFSAIPGDYVNKVIQLAKMFNISVEKL
ncbi:MAG TPA: hypothetical protein ENF87_01335 [Thermoproteales archaeon]|nr:hypothetical protein [Thermoproteales archaeon]